MGRKKYDLVFTFTVNPQRKTLRLQVYATNDRSRTVFHILRLRGFLEQRIPFRTKRIVNHRVMIVPVKTGSVIGISKIVRVTDVDEAIAKLERAGWQSLTPDTEEAYEAALLQGRYAPTWPLAIGKRYRVTLSRNWVGRNLALQTSATMRPGTYNVERITAPSGKGHWLVVCGTMIGMPEATWRKWMNGHDSFAIVFHD